jgi:hypothetical protein
MDDNEEMPVKGTRTHPYMCAIAIDPVDWSAFEAAVEDRPEVKIRKLDDSEPDTWTVYVACASEAVMKRLEKSW